MPSTAYISSLMGIAFALLVIAFAVVWYVFFKDSSSKRHKK